jgi:hypothetical protein
LERVSAKRKYRTKEAQNLITFGSGSGGPDKSYHNCPDPQQWSGIACRYFAATDIHLTEYEIIIWIQQHYFLLFVKWIDEQNKLDRIYLFYLHYSI